MDDVLSCVKPDFVLATGDLTDAQNVYAFSSQQQEAEWAIYHETLKAKNLHENSDFWIDIRGNHDAFDVPDVSHPLNYFAKYSVTKEYDFHRIIQKGNLKIGIVASDAW